MRTVNRHSQGFAAARRCWQWFAAIFLLLAVVARADDFDEGNALFDQGKFAESKQHYEKLIEENRGSANLYYNLGNADYRLGSLGRAILDYERALALSPRHPEALANLKLLREQSGAKLGFDEWWEKLFASLPLQTWTIVLSVSGWIALFALAAALSSRRVEKGALWFLFTAGLAAAVIAALGVWQGWKEESRGIVTAKLTEARLAPAEGAGVAEALPAGSRVRMLSERGPWVYCELPGAGRGWIPRGSLERVIPEAS